MGCRGSRRPRGRLRLFLKSYYTGDDTYHECRVAMAQEQYRSGHHGQYCYQMWMSGRWDFEAPDDRDMGP